METRKVTRIVFFEPYVHLEEAEIDEETLKNVLLESRGWELLETRVKVYIHEEMGEFEDSTTSPMDIDESNIIVYDGHFYGVTIGISDYLLIKEGGSSVEGDSRIVGYGSRSTTRVHNTYTLRRR